MPPHAIVQDFGDINFLPERVAFASYAPHNEVNDVTELTNTLIAQGRTRIVGGPHTVLGDPAPGFAKTLRIWYASKPDDVFDDVEENEVIFRESVVAAFLVPAGMAPVNISEKVRALIAAGRRHFAGGIITPLRFDPAPTRTKQLVVYYDD